MNLPDVNVLVDALMPAAVGHRVCNGWLVEQLDSGQPLAVTTRTGSAVARIATNSRVFEECATLEEVFEFFEAIANHPNCHVLEPGPRHWRIFKDLCVKANARGNLVGDAWLAAIALEHGCTIITHDSGFKKFTGVKFAPPLIGA